MNKKAVVEALVFSTNKGLDLSQIVKVTEFPKNEVISLLEELTEDYDHQDHGISLRKVGRKYSFFTKEAYANYITELIRRPVDKLTPTQLEVLAIVAKNERVTKTGVETIRGKDSSNQLLELMVSGLLKRKRIKAPGRPYAYSVTDNFFEVFKMSDIELSEFLESNDSPGGETEAEAETNAPVPEVDDKKSESQEEKTGETKE